MNSENYNVEIKAKCLNPREIRKILENENAEFKGKRNQIDTYFNVTSGRLKLRESDDENHLIHYNRPDREDPKISEFGLYKTQGTMLKELLVKALGVLTIVDKEREIYLLNNIKFHIDEVKGLGSFVEIEAMGNGNSDKGKLLDQCKYYIKLLRIKDDELLPFSYSDMISEKSILN
jgi:predicted adenylyl cyclase CyaB